MTSATWSRPRTPVMSSAPWALRRRDRPRQLRRSVRQTRAAPPPGKRTTDDQGGAAEAAATRHPPARRAAAAARQRPARPAGAAARPRAAACPRPGAVLRSPAWRGSTPTATDSGAAPPHCWPAACANPPRTASRLAARTAAWPAAPAWPSVRSGARSCPWCKNAWGSSSPSCARSAAAALATAAAQGKSPSGRSAPTLFPKGASATSTSRKGGGPTPA